MLSIAYVILPFEEIAPADAIRASLAPFQRARRGDFPDHRLTFNDGTEHLRRAFEAKFTFTDYEDGRFGIEGDFEASGYVDHERVLDGMRHCGRRSWHVRFADKMDVDSFFRLFSNGFERGPIIGTYGQWLNPLGRWDSWELRRLFDRRITGQPNLGTGLGSVEISSGQSWDRLVLSKLDGEQSKGVHERSPATCGKQSVGNIEFCATLLADALAGRDHAFPDSIVLPPGSAEEHLRWLDALPEPGPMGAFARLGLAVDPKWEEVVEEAYLLFRDHWVAGIVYHN